MSQRDPIPAYKAVPKFLTWHYKNDTGILHSWPDHQRPDCEICAALNRLTGADSDGS